MQAERVLEEIRALHDRIVRAQADRTLPAHAGVPPGVDPLTYALEEVARLRQTVESTYGKPGAAAAAAAEWTPRVGVWASDTRAKIVVELPGVERADVALVVSGKTLVVRGVRREPAHDPELPPVAVELPWGSFERRFEMPDWCSAEMVSARYTNGVLEIDAARRAAEIGLEIA